MGDGALWLCLCVGLTVLVCWLSCAGVLCGGEWYAVRVAVCSMGSAWAVARGYLGCWVVMALAGGRCCSAASGMSWWVGAVRCAGRVGGSEARSMTLYRLYL